MDAQTITVEEAGRILQVSRGTAYRAAKTGEIPAIKIGRGLLVPKPAFEETLRGKRAATASPQTRMVSGSRFRGHRPPLRC